MDTAVVEWGQSRITFACFDNFDCKGTGKASILLVRKNMMFIQI